MTPSRLPPVLDGRSGDDGRRGVDAEVVHRVATSLRAGGVVVIPTDTVYGLAASPRAPGATERIFELKGRSPNVPIAVLCADSDQAIELVDPAGITDEVRRVASRWWPGPLTFVLPRRQGLDLPLGDPPTTVGLRCPDDALVRAIAAEVGPLATTSANRHGEPTPESADALASLFGDRLDLVVDGGRCAGEPSTVVDATGPTWTVLREGALPARALGLPSET